MSAAEKLKALDEARGEFSWEESLQKFNLFYALPQIVAVIEAAEQVAVKGRLADALAALDEALS